MEKKYSFLNLERNSIISTKDKKIKYSKKITEDFFIKKFNELLLKNHSFRNGMSKIQESGIIDLSVSNSLIYVCNFVLSKGIITQGKINFINGVGGEIVYLKVISDEKYEFGNHMKFPSDYKPQPSKIGKTDIYSFMCLGPNEYLGTFAFNYT